MQSFFLPQLKFALFISFLALLSFSSLGATISSTTSGGNWSAATTWVGGVVPTAGDDVVINNGSTVPVDALDIYCKSIRLETGSGASTLSITNAASVIHVSGNVNIDDGEPNILAVNAGNIIVGGDLTIYGN